MYDSLIKLKKKIIVTSVLELLRHTSYVDPKYRVISNKKQLERGRHRLANIAIDVQNFSKINETCENTPSLLSVSETLSTASLSDDELDFEKQLVTPAKRQRLEKEISDEPNL